MREIDRVITGEKDMGNGKILTKKKIKNKPLMGDTTAEDNSDIKNRKLITGNGEPLTEDTTADKIDIGNGNILTDKDITKNKPLTGNITEDREDKSDKNGNEDSNDDSKIKITCFEDLMELVGTSGRWNLIVILACTFSCLLTPFSGISYQFLGVTPDYWCRIPVLEEANWTQQQIINFAIPVSSSGTLDGCHMYNYNYTGASILGYNFSMTNVATLKYDDKLMSCNSRVYNHTQHQSSVVTEWDLTCESRALYSTTQSASQLGTLLGSVLYGHILHTLGRRKGILLSCVLSIIIGHVTIASPNIQTYIFLKFLYQVVDMGYYMGCFVTAIEMCSVKQRTHVGSLFLLPWALGYMMLPGIAYLVRTWRHLQLALALPLFTTLAYYWLLPESPRWLIMRGEYKKALAVLKNAAEVNRRTLPPDEYIISAMDNIKQQENWIDLPLFFSDLEKFIADQYLPLDDIMHINQSTNIYIYTFLGGLLEVPSYLLLWLSIATIGRKKTLVLLYFLSGTSIAALATIMYTSPQVSGVVKVILSLSGKMAITAAFQLIWFYTIELFPTKYRARAVGEASMFCRIGSTTSPYINDIFGEVVVWGPSAVFGPAAFIAMALIFFLPETGNKKLNQIDDKNTLTEQIEMCP